MALIQLRNIYKSFGDNHVLKNMDLDIEQGETLVILGRSGIGKSVTLLIITGLLRPDSGQVFIQGRDIATLPESELIEIRKKFSYVFQSGALFDSLSVFENVAFPMQESHRLESEETISEVEMILKHLDLEGIAEFMPEEISTGMKKRVAIARAMAADPIAILYDEPTTGVDPITGKLISQRIKELKEKLGVTSVVVTHDLKCAGIVADRVAFLHQGGIYFHGTFDEFIRSDLDELFHFKHALPHMMRYIGRE